MFGAEVACLTRSAAARGDEADDERRIKDSRAFRAFCWVGSIFPHRFSTFVKVDARIVKEIQDVSIPATE